MGSTLIVIYVCDRCGERQDIPFEKLSAAKPPERWLVFRRPAEMPGHDGRVAAHICDRCVTDFLGFMPTEPAPPLSEDV